MSHCQWLHLLSKIMHTKFHASIVNNHRKIAPGVLVMYRTRSTKRLLQNFTMSHYQWLHILSEIMHTKFHASIFNSHRKIAPGVLVMYPRRILLLISCYIFIFRNHVLKQKFAATIKDNTHQIARFYLQQGIKYRTRSKKRKSHQEYKTPLVFATRPPKGRYT